MKRTSMTPKTRSPRKTQSVKKIKSSSSNLKMWGFFVLALIVFSSIFYYKYYRSIARPHEDIIKLVDIFKKIDKECIILNCEQECTAIDFLNVKEFSGSTVGPLRLQYPEKWQGPYVKENITYKGHPYSLLVTKNGYFIVPGNGTVLDDGNIIGKDIIFNSETDIAEFITKYPALIDNKKIMCAGIPILGKVSGLN